MVISRVLQVQIALVTVAGRAHILKRPFLPKLRAGGPLLTPAGFWWAGCHPDPLSGHLFFLPHRGRIPTAPRCQSQADRQHSVQLPPTLQPHDRREHDLCRKPAEAWARHLPGQRLQMGLESKRLAGPYTGHRPPQSPGLGDRLRDPPAVKHRPRLVYLNPYQSRKTQHNNHSGYVACIAAFHPCDTLVKGDVTSVI